SPQAGSNKASVQVSSASVLTCTDRTEQLDHAQPQSCVALRLILLPGFGATKMLSGVTSHTGLVISPDGSASKSGSLYTLVVLKLVARHSLNSNRQSHFTQLVP